jgi:fatty acid desaturase
MTTLEGRRRRRRHEFDAATNAELKALARRRDNWHGPLAFAQDVLIIGAAIGVSVAEPLCYPMSLALIGTRQRAMATLVHESSHLTLCANRVLNTTIGVLAGYTVFQSLRRYRQSHVDEHHPHLGDPERDPDMMNYERQGLFNSKAETFFKKHLLPLAVGLKTWQNFGNLLRDRLLPKGWRKLSRAQKSEYIGFLVFWAVMLVVMGWAGLLTHFLMLWLVPYFTVFQAVNWLIEVGEHFPLVKLFDHELEMTRNRRGNAAERFFFGIHGENWHLVHHLRPGIPFWHLAEANRIMMRDPAYAAANSLTGGLVTRGPCGEPSILSLMGEQLSAVQTAR